MDNPLLFGLASGGALLLAFLLFTRPKGNNVYANRWLGLFVATLAASALHIYLNKLNLQAQYHQLILLIEVAEFLTAPALYLGISFFTIPGRTFKRTDLWHFVPAAFILLFLIKPLAIGNNVEFSDSIVKDVVLTLLVLTRPIQTIIYLFFSYRKLVRHQRNIQLVSSSTEATDLSWLKYSLLVWAAVILIWFNLAFFNFTYLSPYTALFYLAGLYCLAYFSLQQKETYPFAPAEIKELAPVINAGQVPKPERYKRLPDDIQVGTVKDKLEKLMKYDQVYLDNALSLPALAKLVGISAHDLSYLLNEVYGENFYSFINRHRVEEAKRLLLSQTYHQLNMLGIAYQAGFNSKTAFNTAFRKWTGQSPTQFLQSSAPEYQSKEA